MSRDFLIIGGYLEDTESLAPLADAAVDLDLADRVGTMTLERAMSTYHGAPSGGYQHLDWSAYIEGADIDDLENVTVLPHSAAVMAKHIIFSCARVISLQGAERSSLPRQTKGAFMTQFRPSPTTYDPEGNRPIPTGRRFAEARRYGRGNFSLPIDLARGRVSAARVVLDHSMLTGASNLYVTSGRDEHGFNAGPLAGEIAGSDLVAHVELETANHMSPLEYPNQVLEQLKPHL